ncbi:MAG: RNA polymerase sigma factor [Saprospiraceae bacterium]
MTEQELIEAVKRDDRKAQKLLFDRYAPKMFGVCKRYVKNKEDAEDVLIDGLFKVMTKIDHFKGTGSFEGWIRRILVNESLMFLRKQHNFKLTVEVSNIEIKSQLNVEDKLREQDILNLLDKLPTGYRTVFNLYVVEGYKHREIAEILGISINTSKSQLILAKKRLQGLVRESNQYPGVG